jgi:hypothetical protein
MSNWEIGLIGIALTIMGSWLKSFLNNIDAKVTKGIEEFKEWLTKNYTPTSELKLLLDNTTLKFGGKELDERIDSRVRMLLQQHNHERNK